MLLRWAAGLSATVLWGVIAGWWTPRGPVTTTEALASIGLSLAVGFAAGRLTRSRWALLLAPVLFAVAVEVTRVGYAGPTVDWPHASVLGVLALLVGRGVHGLLALLPLAVGAIYGAGAARHAVHGAGTVRRWSRRVGAALGLAVVLIVAAAVTVPARTAMIPGGVAELTTVHGMGVLIRGTDRTAPVLLFMAGSPGGSEMGAMRLHLAALEQDFVVATVDRRGGGNSYGSLDPLSTLTLDDEVGNLLAVTAYLRQRFGQDRIFLVGHSGSSVQAILAVQRRPQWFRAYVGAGQAVDLTAADQGEYRDELAWAQAHDATLDEQLTAAGPPPYDDLWGYEPMLLAEGRVFAYPGGADSSAGQAENFAVDEHSLLDKVHVFSGFLDTYGALYRREMDVDFRVTVPVLQVPVYFVLGEHEVPSRAQLLRQWYETLQAPHRELVTFPAAGHRAPFEQPELFAALLAKVKAQN